MESPLQIVYRDVAPYESLLEPEIRKWAGNLEKHFSRIVSCRVVVDKVQNRHKVGNLYRATVSVKVPAKTIVVSREHPLHHSHEDIFVAVHHAFQEVTRQLEEYARMRQGDVKSHDLAPHGVVAKLFPHEGYGFIQTPDAREIYFHKNSVLDGFDSLAIGQEVRFDEEPGEKGPQASTVKILRAEHVHHRKH
jgi:cold shock CspA family protein/ribosome-associated translation inhibitor RaiA